MVLLEEVEASKSKKKAEEGGGIDEDAKGKRHCKTCGEASHHSRICKIDINIP